MCILTTSWFCESVNETDVKADDEADGDNGETATEANGSADVEVDGDTDDDDVNKAIEDAARKADGEAEGDDGDDFAPTFTWNIINLITPTEALY